MDLSQDLPQIATSLASTLAPYLPALVKGVAIDAGKTVTKAVKEAVEWIWSHVAPAFASNSQLKFAASGAKDGLPHTAYEQALKDGLKEYLEAHPGVVDAMRGRADDTPMGIMLQKALNGGIIDNCEQLQVGVAADMKQVADGGEIRTSKQHATEGSHPKA